MRHDNEVATFDPAPLESTRQLLYDYIYIESRIPVILTISFDDNHGHAIVVAGHHLSATAPPHPADEPYLHASQWIPSYIVMDNQSGPYHKLVLSRLGDLPEEERDAFLRQAARKLRS